ncbi:cardiolipin synthase [Mangrovimicrobium sediminis]|uniref:Cardiolipin synthase n=1 Tax=Mangrovimicrobium sediminis TaxID=2562682 RepID=A0A4Z0M3S2_9GAMM|nr:cardiolipin synthase [Haliea sp. SAOS-164]TGD74018.1 cardiolipin synthase [Haliea sp. SAOS-164]
MDNTLLAELIALGLLLLYAASVVAALEAILKSRTSQGAIAWVLSLVTIPILALPLYLVFGRNRFDGYMEKRDQIESESLALLERASGSIRGHLVGPGESTPLYTSLFNLARMPATTGNRVELLIDGEATFASLLEGLQRAQRYILFQFYIIRDDALGRELGRVLADKARDGLQVYLLYDEIGSRPFHRSRLLRQLRMSGVHVAPFNTTQGYRNRFQLNFRNHRKVVVIDGREAWVGGHNVGDEYLGRNPDIGHWRDTHVHVHGPAVMGAELAFATDWLWASNGHLAIDWDFNGAAPGSSEVLVFPSDPASEYEETALMFLQTIVAARKRIWIASPYFVPDSSIVAALQLAALNGVDVRVLIPDEPDGPVVGLANWSFTRQLIPAGVGIYRYQGGFMHQKVLLMDDSLAGVGTANFDNRSFRLNFEITLLVEDADFAAQVADMLETDFARSHRVGPADFANRPMWFTLGMATARLFSPVL